MDFYDFALVTTLIYVSVYFIDVFLKTCSHHPYMYFLENTGLKIGIFKIQWNTTVFNDYFHDSVRWQPKFLQRWFTLGVWVTITILPLAVFLIISTAISSLMIRERDTASTSRLTLEPMIPGINLPLNDMCYYIIAILISSVVHEAGHALAAVREGVQISGFGICILVILPSAYVLLKTSQVEALPPYRSLRILTAGVWHNIVLAVLATLAVFVTPYILSPFFFHGKGIFTVDLPEDSPFRGPTGLVASDIITKVNGHCDVKNKEDWKNCITEAITELDFQRGYCISSSLVEDAEAQKNTDCCSGRDKEGYLCFSIYAPNVDPKENANSHQTLAKKSYCLPARAVVEESSISCKIQSCPRIYPLCALPNLSNDTALFVIKKENKDAIFPKSVIFLGHPSEAWWNIKVSNFAPRLTFFHPKISSLPEAIVHQLKYLAVLSSGLALVNVLPLFMFDGQHIITVLLRQMTKNFISTRISDKIARYIVIFGSICLGFCLISTFLNVYG